MTAAYNFAKRTRMRDDRIIRLIALFRFAKAALLIAGGCMLLRPVRILQWASHVPRAMAFASRLEDPHRAHLLAIAAFAYSALFVTEGVGLWMVKKWAEYLTIIATASLLPFELYELVHKVTALRLVVLLINVGVLIYLVWRVRRRDD
jgi:uncharacterized membrane protein (DUF2068 family)